MTFAQPLRETSRGRAPNLAGLCVRQDKRGYPAPLVDVSSPNLAGGTNAEAPGSFPLKPARFLHVWEICTPSFSKVIIMSIATRVRDRFRSRLAKFVALRRAETGCAKIAIKDVARKIGMSTANVYRAMNGTGSCAVRDHQHIALLLHFFGAMKRSGSRLFKHEQRSRAGLSA